MPEKQLNILATVQVTIDRPVQLGDRTFNLERSQHHRLSQTRNIP
ncbi:MAG: hypothetical protein ACPGVO_14235 [Spirulinaceae cyanobacterium]